MAVTDILAIVSKAVFAKDARIGNKVIAPNDVWPVDRYNSTAKALQALKNGGRIFLVTVRPPNEQLWLLGVISAPKFNGTAWVASAPNTVPVTNITPLRKTLVFESGNGISQDRGVLGMSLQTPRALAASDVTQILAAVGGNIPTPPIEAPPSSRVIGGKYEVIRKLGVGGMGVVYEARHTGTGRRVAVKEIAFDALREDAQVVERFQREARVTGAIETQHIALVLDSGSDAATSNPFLVMELLQGEDLQQLIERLGPLPEDVALKIVAQACVGLARAHEAGVVHRDIKPANLFLARRDGGEVIVKLLDFGIARVKEQMSTSENRALTTTGLMLGTPLYMSPEQILQGPKNLDQRTDLWSLGVVLHEALTGRTPQGDVETPGALLVSICSKPARPIREIAPHVREGVQAIVKKSLELEARSRYASADEMLADLKRELPSGIALDESMLVALPDKTRAEVDAQPLELADTIAQSTPPIIPSR